MKYRKIKIEDSNWSSLHDLEERIPFSFSSEGEDDTVVELKGVRLGNLDESMAIPVKAVKHDFMEEDGYRVEASSVIPFGSEPYISRKFEYLGNIIKVTSDIRVKATINGNVFSVDDLVLKAKWKRFAVLDKKPASKIKWEKIKVGDSVIYDSNDLFAVLLFESEDGSRIEIGTGFDIWRWNIAESIEGISGKLEVIATNGEITVKRAVMESDDEFEIPKRDWRFTWYLAWSSGEGMPESNPEGKNIFSIDQFDFRESGRIMKSGKLEAAPCFHSNATRNLLRKWLRSFSGKNNGEELILTGMQPGICENPSHLERPKSDPLLHWDMPDIIDFWFWANRHLRRKGNVLSIFPGNDKIFSQLPSFIAMKVGKIQDSGSKIQDT